MKLEKDRLIAKVESLQLSKKQLLDEQTEQGDLLAATQTSKRAKEDLVSAGARQSHSTAAKAIGPTPIPTRDRFNPLLNETFEAVGGHLTQFKSFKGHLQGVTCMSFNPKKDIVATGSDDTTWKLWSVPNGDLIMSGEGHLDWVGGLQFHPKGNLLATCSGDGSVKLWDFVTASCAATLTDHGVPVWKVDFHDTGDFLLSCSMDQTIKLWDLHTRKSRFTFRGHVDSVNSVQFMPYN